MLQLQFLHGESNMRYSLIQSPNWEPISKNSQIFRDCSKNSQDVGPGMTDIYLQDHPFTPLICALGNSN